MRGLYGAALGEPPPGDVPPARVQVTPVHVDADHVNNSRCPTCERLRESLAQGRDVPMAAIEKRAHDLAHHTHDPRLVSDARAKD